jgi:hypothetical protein
VSLACCAGGVCAQDGVAPASMKAEKVKRLADDAIRLTGNVLLSRHPW